MDLRFPGECVVCKSPNVALTRRIPTSRKMDVDLFYCMDCESFFSPFAPVHFNGPTLNHHRKVFDRNIGFTQTWFSAISSFLDSSPYVVDIGCGIGSLLFGLREQGIRGVGYDLDREATEFVFKEYHLDLR